MPMFFPDWSAADCVPEIAPLDVGATRPPSALPATHPSTPPPNHRTPLVVRSTGEPYCIASAAPTVAASGKTPIEAGIAAYGSAPPIAVANGLRSSRDENAASLFFS